MPERVREALTNKLGFHTGYIVSQIGDCSRMKDMILLYHVPEILSKQKSTEQMAFPYSSIANICPKSSR
ncbi:MAG: hypothetical protein ACREBQ_13120, partial [Nitrososphaerales archaeon]